LISLVDEDRHELGKYDLPNGLLGEFAAIFNSCSLVRILRDKRKTNDYLTSAGMQKPGWGAGRGKKVFSLPRTGYGHAARLADYAVQLDDASYSAEFIDTKVRFKDRLYYTSLRLMCIGPNVLKVIVQVCDFGEQKKLLELFGGWAVEP